MVKACPCAHPDASAATGPGCGLSLKYSLLQQCASYVYADSSKIIKEMISWILPENSTVACVFCRCMGLGRHTERRSHGMLCLRPAVSDPCMLTKHSLHLFRRSMCWT